FSSVRRDRVFVDVCKTFDEPFGAQVDARIAGLKPGFYTRLGAAIRHVSFRLSERPNARKLLLVITDGKPNDIDHYEGRFGIEDTRMAVQEARRLGQAVFAITVDEQARAYLPYLFGRSGYAMAPASDRLIDALPAIYRHIVA
ncbi:MAG TPA: VWA domain-containing protein, partial [Beijerinckiaceae bacterium]|nr:VWA domain-containing protein [Beijerinckiaceae bacterium]